MPSIGKLSAKTVALAVCLGLSLAANGWLLARQRSAPAPARAPAVARPTPIAPLRIAPPEHPPLDAIWADMGPRDDLRELGLRLRAAGISSDVIRALAKAMVRERKGYEYHSVFYPKDKPFWRHRVAHHTQLEPIEREMDAMYQAMTGENTSMFKPLPAEQAIRDRLYGNLSPERITAIQKINFEHNQLRDAIPAKAPDRAQQWAAVKARELERIASILTPAEFEDYKRRQLEMNTANAAGDAPGK